MYCDLELVFYDILPGNFILLPLLGITFDYKGSNWKLEFLQNQQSRQEHLENDP